MVHTGASAANVVGAYIDFVGRTDQDLYEQPWEQDALALAARHLGEGCRILTITRNERKARSFFLTAQTLLSRPSNNERSRNLAALLALNAAVVTKWQHPENIERVQTRIRQETARQVASELSALTPRPDSPGHFAHKKRIAWDTGTIVERSALGLLGRIEDPQTLALAALLHHDIGRPETASNHFDLSHSIAGGSLACTQKIQMKAACFGMCDRSPRVSMARFQRLRLHYTNEIVLLSGCCDLGLTKVDDTSYDLSTSLALVREVEGSASGRERARLDAVSAHLIAVLTNPEDRVGRLPSGGATAAA